MPKKNRLRSTQEQSWPIIYDDNYPVGEDKPDSTHERLWPTPERPDDEPHRLESERMFDDTDLEAFARIRARVARRRIQLEEGLTDEEISAAAAADIAADKAKRQEEALDNLRAARERANDAPAWLRQWQD